MDSFKGYGDIREDTAKIVNGSGNILKKRIIRVG